MKTTETTTTMSSKGLVTIPRNVRERLGLQAGDKITWAVLGNGTVVVRPTKRGQVDLVGGQPQPSLTAARARGSAYLADWISQEVVVLGATFAARRGVSPRTLSASVRCGELFSVGIKGRRYYVATLLQVEAAAAASVCRALTMLGDMEKAIFWLRPHGALAAETVATAIRAGKLDQVLKLAHARTAQARAAQLLARPIY